MNCKEARAMMPEYLAGTIDEGLKIQIESHIHSCTDCKNELDDLTHGIDLEPFPNDHSDNKKILKKTNMRFNVAIIRTVLIVIGLFILLSMVPTFLWGIQSAFGQSNASRALMDYVQFSQPDKVNMWGNRAVEGFSFSVPLQIGTRPVIGRNYREQKEITGKMSVITGKVTDPVFLGANFIHPDLFAGMDFKDNFSISKQTERLAKNAETTVATVDYSLNKTIGLKELNDIINKFDIEPCWMAVEAGIENIEPKNMTYENQQVLQWGIPATLSKPGDFDFASFKKDGAEKYEKAVIDELKWLENNKGVLKPDSQLLKQNGINNSVTSQVQYILKNGIKIYGLRVTGPSSELMKLTNELDTRTMTVVDLDFWNW